jgi:hypothetical protein
VLTQIILTANISTIPAAKTIIIINKNEPRVKETSMKSRGLHYYVAEERKKERKSGVSPAAAKAIKLHTLKVLPGSLAIALSLGLLPMSSSFLDPCS